MNPRVAMPSHKRGQKLAFSFDEDELTLAWDAVRQASLASGTAVAPVDFTPPRWFLSGLGLISDANAAIQIELVATTQGPSVIVRQTLATIDVEAEAKRLHQAAPQRPEPEWQRHRVAREGPDTEADFPLGAFVLATRHDEVTSQRMKLLPGKILSFTRIGPGAAPTEFSRLQEAVGAYHVVLVEGPEGRTVGIWAGDVAPAIGQTVVPTLRRLFRTQSAWRHGVKFAPV